MSLNEKHPIEKLMGDAMERIKSVIDVDTIIGEPIISPNGSTVVPISKVSVGFVAGGGEYNENTFKKTDRDYPFAGGSGVGFTVTPIGFLNLSGEEIKMINAKCPDHPYEHLTELFTKLIEVVTEALKK